MVGSQLWLLSLARPPGPSPGLSAAPAHLLVVSTSLSAASPHSDSAPANSHADSAASRSPLAHANANGNAKPNPNLHRKPGWGSAHAHAHLHRSSGRHSSHAHSFSSDPTSTDSHPVSNLHRNSTRSGESEGHAAESANPRHPIAFQEYHAECQINVVEEIDPTDPDQRQANAETRARDQII